MHIHMYEWRTCYPFATADSTCADKESVHFHKTIPLCAYSACVKPINCLPVLGRLVFDMNPHNIWVRFTAPEKSNGSFTTSQVGDHSFSDCGIEKITSRMGWWKHYATSPSQQTLNICIFTTFFFFKMAHFLAPELVRQAIKLESPNL